MTKDMKHGVGSHDVLGAMHGSPVPAYEAPVLKVIGDASDVVMGYPGNWFDYPDGITEPAFEFEHDGD